MPFIHNCKEQKKSAFECVCQRKGNGENQNNQKGLHIKGKGDSEWMGICDDMLREFLGCIEGRSELRAYDKPGSMRG